MNFNILFKKFTILAFCISLICNCKPVRTNKYLSEIWEIDNYTENCQERLVCKLGKQQYEYIYGVLGVFKDGDDIYVRTLTQVKYKYEYYKIHLNVCMYEEYIYNDKVVINSQIKNIQDLDFIPANEVLNNGF